MCHRVNLRVTHTHTHTQLRITKNTICGWVLCNSFGTTIRFTLLFFGMTLMLHQGNSQVIPASPCTCEDPIPIGKSEEETLISELLHPLQTNECYLVKGTLIVDQTTLWQGVRIIMEEGGAIVVQQSVELAIRYCNISACDYMWQGIISEGADDGYLFLHYSMIQTANTGVKLRSMAGFGCYFTHFVDNYIGIAVGSPFETEELGKTMARHEVSGCKFYTLSGLRDPYPGHHYYPIWPTAPATIPYDQGYAAIYLSGINAMNIGLVEAAGSFRNEVYNMRNGVIMRNSTANVYGTDFYDFEGGRPRTIAHPVLDLNQYAIHSFRSVGRIVNNTMDNVFTGVHADESGNWIVTNQISISTPSPFSTRTRGISAVRLQSLSIMENEIHEGFSGIAVTDVANNFVIKSNSLTRSYDFPANIGIDVRNFKNAHPDYSLIQNNDIEITDGNGSFGLYFNNVNQINVITNPISFVLDQSQDLQNSGSICVNASNMNLRYNTIEADAGYNYPSNLGISQYFSFLNNLVCNSIENMYQNIHFIGPNIETRLNSNIIHDGSFGLYLLSPITMGTQQHQGNQWTGDYDEYGAYISDAYAEAIESALGSMFIIDSGDDADFLPPSIGPIAIEEDWFIDTDDPGPQMHGCISSLPDPKAVADSVAKVIRHPVTFTEFNDQMIWLTKADVFEMMLHDDDLFSHTALDSFFDAEVNTNLGKLVQWQVDLGLRHGLQKEDKEDALDRMEILSNTIASIDSLLYLDDPDSVALRALRILKADTLSSITTDWLDLLTEEHSESYEMYEDIAYALTTISPANNMESALRKTLYLRAQYLMGEIISPTDSLTLLEYAELCPWLGGRAIGLAQGLYASISGTTLVPILDNCPTPEPFRYSAPVYQRDIQPQWSVFPNPTNDLINISATEPILDVRLSDSTMRLVAAANPDAYTWTIPTRTYPEGMYILTLLFDSGPVTHKLIISR